MFGVWFFLRFPTFTSHLSPTWITVDLDNCNILTMDQMDNGLQGVQWKAVQKKKIIIDDYIDFCRLLSMCSMPLLSNLRPRSCEVFRSVQYRDKEKAHIHAWGKSVKDIQGILCIPYTVKYGWRRSTAKCGAYVLQWRSWHACFFLTSLSSQQS